MIELNIVFICLEQDAYFVPAHGSRQSEKVTFPNSGVTNGLSQKSDLSGKFNVFGFFADTTINYIDHMYAHVLILVYININSFN